MSNVSIVIVTFQSADVLPRLLDSLDRQDLPAEGYELIVVDNDSRDGSVRIIEEHFPRVRLIKNAKNKGFAAAANQGAGSAQGNYLLFLNPDTVLDKGFLRTGCRALEEDPGVGVLAPRLVSPDGKEQPGCWKAPSWHTFLTEVLLPHRLATRIVTERPGVIVAVRGVSGACLLTRKDVFERVGGFDERFFMYYEDLDYCRRVEAEGYQIMHHHELAIVHTIASSSHKDPETFFTTYYRSRLAYYCKHLSLPSLVGPVMRVGLLLRIVSYSLPGVFLPRFAELSHSHRIALRSLPH